MACLLFLFRARFELAEGWPAGRFQLGASLSGDHQSVRSDFRNQSKAVGGPIGVRTGGHQMANPQLAGDRPSDTRATRSLS